MATQKNVGAARFGYVLGSSAQVGITTWAALSTTGALSICLWVLVGIMGFGILSRAARGVA